MVRACGIGLTSQPAATPASVETIHANCEDAGSHEEVSGPAPEWCSRYLAKLSHSLLCCTRTICGFQGLPKYPFRTSIYLSQLLLPYAFQQCLNNALHFSSGLQ